MVTILLPMIRPDLATLLCICWAMGLAKGRAGENAALAANSEVGPYKVPSGPKAFCSPCDIRTCPHITPEMCEGKLVKDDCGCCPQCDLNQRTSGMASSISSNQTCADVECSGNQVCMLNIQGIPICRCPSVFMCRRQARRDVCGRDGKTYRSKCYLKLTECTQNKKIRVAHKGVCVPKSPISKKARKKNREVLARRNRRRRKQKGKGLGKKERGQNGRPKRDHGNRHQVQGRFLYRQRSF